MTEYITDSEELELLVDEALSSVKELITEISPEYDVAEDTIKACKKDIVSTIIRLLIEDRIAMITLMSGNLKAASETIDVIMKDLVDIMNDGKESLELVQREVLAKIDDKEEVVELPDDIEIETTDESE